MKSLHPKNNDDHQPQPGTASSRLGAASETVALAAESTMEAAAEVASDLKEKGAEWAQLAGDKLGEVREVVSAKSSELCAEARDQAVVWRDTTSSSIRENPLPYVVGALFAGLLLGFSMRRR